MVHAAVAKMMQQTMILLGAGFAVGTIGVCFLYLMARAATKAEEESLR